MPINPVSDHLRSKTSAAFIFDRLIYIGSRLIVASVSIIALSSQINSVFAYRNDDICYMDPYVVTADREEPWDYNSAFADFDNPSDWWYPQYDYDFDNFDPEQPPDKEDEKCDDAGSGGEGVNPFNVYDGSVTREITDLRMVGAADQPVLKWTRYHNTISRNGLRIFGQGGDWRHSFQYELIADTEKPNTARHIAFIAPAGGRRMFTQQPDGTWAAEARYVEELRETAQGFELTTSTKAKVFFIRTNNAVRNREYLVQNVTIKDGEYSLEFEHNEDDQITRVTDSEGRQIQIDYAKIRVTTLDKKRLTTIKRAPAQGQWLEIRIPRHLQKLLVSQLRLIGQNSKPLSIAEIQFFGPDTNQPIAISNAYGTGNAAEAFDSNTATIFVGERNHYRNYCDAEFSTPQYIARIRILAAPGKEAELTNVAIDAYQTCISTISCAETVSTNDGQSLHYEYDLITGKSSLQQYPVMARVCYPDTTIAKYGYQTADELPRLETADDPYYKGRAKTIRYIYAESTIAKQRGEGIISKEVDLQTGAVYASLDFDEKDPDVRIVSYADMRTVTYRVPKATNGRVTEYIDSLGRKTSYEYADGGKGALKSKTKPDGVKTEFTSDASGRFLSAKRNDGYEITLTRDLKGRVQKVVDNQGRSKKLERDAVGRITAFTDEASLRISKGQSRAFAKTKKERTSIARDSKGRIISETLPDGSTRVITRDSRGRVTDYSNSKGDSRKFSRDKRGNITAVRSLDGSTTRYIYDHQNRIIRVEKPEGHAIAFERNARGLVTRKTNPDGTTHQYIYDSYGRKISEIDEIGRTAKWEFDNLSRLTRYQDVAEAVTVYDYTETPGGCSSCSLIVNPSRIIYANGRVDEFLYDTEGHLMMQSIAVGTLQNATTLYAYDSNNNLIQQTNPDGGIIKHTYDTHQNRTSTTDPLGRVTVRTYDENNRQLSELTPSGRNTDYAYDFDGNLIYVLAADGSETTYAYDSKRHRISAVDALGNTTQWMYNKAGDLITVIDAAGGITRHTYDTAHRRLQTIFPDDTRQTWNYDAAGRIVKTKSV